MDGHLASLAVLPDDGSGSFAVPVTFKVLGTFPVRVFGMVGGSET